MNRRNFLKLIGIGGAAALTPAALFAKRPRKFPDDATADEINEFLYFRGLRPCPHSHHSTDEEFAKCSSGKRCRTCGATTDAHRIDCSLPLHSKERARTVCFSCVPEARVIDRYYSNGWSWMTAKKKGIACSECKTGMGYIHVVGKPFDYRLCPACAPEAKNARRWVRDLAAV